VIDFLDTFVLGLCRISIVEVFVPAGERDGYVVYTVEVVVYGNAEQGKAECLCLS